MLLDAIRGLTNIQPITTRVTVRSTNHDTGAQPGRRPGPITDRGARPSANESSCHGRDAAPYQSRVGRRSTPPITKRYSGNRGHPVPHARCYATIYTHQGPYCPSARPATWRPQRHLNSDCSAICTETAPPSSVHRVSSIVFALTPPFVALGNKHQSDKTGNDGM